MQIVDFNESHIPMAAKLALKNYNEEKEIVGALPPVKNWPDLKKYAENGLGVAAFEEDTMLGFLCAGNPFKNAFGSTDAAGVFSPLHGNGAVIEKRGAVYGRMYQKAAEKWAASGAASHAICVYAHDKASKEQLFNYGFGSRCIDAIRPMEEIEGIGESNYTLVELKKEDYKKVYPLYEMLENHMAESPCFIKRPFSFETFMISANKPASRFFAAMTGNEMAAFLKTTYGGETFITYNDDIIHIDGAFCLPEHRGKGIYSHLLNYTIQILKKEGNKYLSVDFESINPSAHNFWTKYFSVYTCGLARRIDEHCINRIYK